jgi:FkbM family methyltransferase
VNDQEIAVGANSALRRTFKRIVHPLVSPTMYRWFQGLAKAWDIRRGSWREPEIELVYEAVGQGDTVLDIGANYGVYCYHFSRAVGEKGRVLAFEPVPETCSTLSLVVKLLGLRNVEIFNKGCGDETGLLSFEVPVQSSGASAAGQAYMARRVDDHPGKEEQVRWKATMQVRCEVVRLDDFLPEVNELSFVKCDIEGAELLAFRGGEKTISRHLPSVICEINPWFLEGFEIQLDALTGFFFERGYRLYRYVQSDGKGRLRIQPSTPIEEDNYLFIHPVRLPSFAPFLDAIELEEDRAATA